MMRTIFFSCFLLSLVACKKTKPAPEPPVTPPAADTVAFAKGADISWITQMEGAGRHFYNAAGTDMEPTALLKSLGMNTVRLRVWVDPAGGWNGATDLLVKAQRAKALGMRLMIDFHYSDTWADPGAQTKPAAWASMNFTDLKAALATHTVQILTLLKNNSITPEWIQVGNETNNGMLWPDGRASTNMAAFAQLVNSGYDAVKSVFPSAKVIVHLSNGNDNSLYRWMFDGLTANGARYDIIGMSLYPSTTNWASMNQLLLVNMNDMISRYNKDVMVVEVGMPWDSPAESGAFLSDIMTKTRSIANHRGLGVLYWEPEAYGTWQGYTLGAFDNAGKPTGALAAFQ
jgi:arabinogalactan endo-1,4-beta-galactosidase